MIKPSPVTSTHSTAEQQCDAHAETLVALCPTRLAFVSVPGDTGGVLETAASTVSGELLAIPIPTSGTSPVEYFLLPLFGLSVIGLLALVLRWSHQPAKDNGRGGAAIGDQGLLVPVVSVPDEQRARELARRLGEIGIRATVSLVRREHLVLVWPWQAQAARDCLARSRDR